MARPNKHSHEQLVAVLNSLVRPHSGPVAFTKKNGLSLAALYAWRKQSADDEKAGRTDSDFYLEWLGNLSWFHRHWEFSRAVSIARIDAQVIEAATCSRIEPLFNPQTGAPFWVVDAKIASDAKLLDDDTWHLIYGLDRDKSDIYERDENGALIQATKEVAPNPQALMFAAKNLLASTYGDTIRHELLVGGVLRIGSTPTPAPALPPPVDVDFLQIDAKPEAPEQQTNVLAVAERPASVQDFEETFGGRRLVECVYFYDDDDRLLPPLDGIVIVKGSSADRLYNEHGIEHATTPARELIEAGYVNEFLLKLATPAEMALVADLRAKLKRGIPHPLPTRGPPPPPEDDVETDDMPAPRRMETNMKASTRYDAENIGYGRPPPGGRRVNL
jgi:hypothetical protein